jgi:hypothetical protein
MTANTIGTVLVACRKGATAALVNAIVRPERDQLHREFAKAISVASGPAVIDPHIAAVGPAQLLQSLHECREAGLTYRMVFGERHEHTDAPDLRRLRARRERPRHGRAADERDEVASFHSITSSARPSSIGGTVRPIVLAVFRLITSSNLVGCWTGRSAGFSPMNMR